MTDQLIGYATLALGSAGIVYVLTRRWEKRFRAAVAAAFPPITDADGEDESENAAEFEGPVLVDPAALRALIRDAVREGLSPAGGRVAP